MLNRKVVTIVLSLVLFSSGVFYVASAKSDGGGGSPWESILSVFVTGGEVNISRPVVLDPGTHIDVSGSTVDVSGSSVDVTGSIDVSGSVDVSGSTVDVSGSSVDVSGPVSLAAGTQIGIAGDVSLEAGTQVEVIGEVEVTGDVSLAWGTTVGLSGPVALEPDTEVTVTSDTWNQPIWEDITIASGDAEYSLTYLVDGYKYVHIAKDSPHYELTVKYIWDMPDDHIVTMTTSIDGVSAPGVYTIGVKAPKIFMILRNVSSNPTATCSVVFYAVS